MVRLRWTLGHTQCLQIILTPPVAGGDSFCKKCEFNSAAVLCCAGFDASGKPNVWGPCVFSAGLLYLACLFYI